MTSLGLTLLVSLIRSPARASIYCTPILHLPCHAPCRFTLLHLQLQVGSAELPQHTASIVDSAAMDVFHELVIRLDTEGRCCSACQFSTDHRGAWPFVLLLLCV